jgi:hypothetical protein
MSQESDDTKLTFEEFTSLRSEIENTLKEYGNLEKAVAGACAAIYAWLAKGDSGHPTTWAAWVIPVGLAGLGGLRAYGLHRRLAELGSYIFMIETEIYGQSNRIEQKLRAGWEHFCSKDGQPRNGMISWSATAFWTLLGCITSGVAVWKCFH